MNLFGWEFGKKTATDKIEPVAQSIVEPDIDDGTMQVSSAASYYGYYVDMDGTVKDEIQAISKYREISLYPEVDIAIQDIINEAIPYEDDSPLVEIILDRLEVSDPIKEIIINEFKGVLSLLSFSEKAPDIFRRWYVDGRLYFNVLTGKNQKDGILELRPIEATKIKKVAEIKKEKTKEGVDVVTGVKEYYLYSQNGFIPTTNLAQAQNYSPTTGVRLSPDSIIYVPSGFNEQNTGVVLSYLQKALRPANQLRMLEDAVVIYRMSRAPERRIFYIDVGNLPKGKAEQYVKDIMNRYRNKLVYDTKTGEIRDDKKYMCLDMNTLVPLLDGRTLSISEIANEKAEGKELWAYSCHPETGEFVPGIISWAGVTRKNADVVRITLDNGKSITCTPDHKFPVWNKGLVEAKDLSIGESMIPHYTKQNYIRGRSTTSKLPYLQIFDNKDKKWNFVHRAVSDWKDFVDMDNECVFNESIDTNIKRTVHHKDFNKNNNSPDNLVQMNSADYAHYHTFHIPREVLVERGKHVAKKYKTEYTKSIFDFVLLNKHESKKYILEQLNKKEDLLVEWRKLNTNKVGTQKDWSKLNKSDVYRIFESLEFNNHKIVDIEFLSNKMDTGCITIDADETYHNYHTFALDAGIYTRNSMMEDFWMPRRDGCFSLNTKIKLLDGRDVELGQLIVEHKLGKENWVYSVSPTGKVVPGLISWAGVTRNNTEVIDVHLDNGEIITCTPDHKFILRNGEKIEAKMMVAGTSLMPLNTRFKKISKKDYAQIQHNDTEDYEYVHSMVSSYIDGDKNKDQVVHHINFNRFDNTPDNLLLMTKQDHLNYHSMQGKMNWEIGDRASHIKKLIARNSSCELPQRRKQYVVEGSTNHKVVKVVARSELIDVGTLTIDEHHIHHDYHNFALSSGIFVMNSKGTEISTLEGGQNLGELSDVEYFQNKLYQALNIPLSRMAQDSGFSMGRSTEISRDEVKFQKFIGKIRRKFSGLFFDILRTQLTLKEIIAEDEWQEIKENISFRFQKDNFFAELKNNEILMQRIQAAQSMDFMLGKYFSVEWIAKNVFFHTNEEIIELQQQMADEYKSHPWWFSAEGMYYQQQALQRQQVMMTMSQGQDDSMQPQQGQEMSDQFQQ